jgi:hypothetical protein
MWYPSAHVPQIASQVNDIESKIASRIDALTASIPSSELSRAASAQTALAKFVATAPSSLSIPDKVTEVGALETFKTTPAWFSALPTDLKSYYESANARVQSVVDQAAGVTPSSVTPSAAAPSNTGAANSDKLVQYMGVGAAAALAGVFAL